MLVRHRRPLFGISWLMVSYVFFALYIVMAFGAAVGEPVVSGVAYLLSGLVEERDIRPADRQSRRLGAWRRGLAWGSLFATALAAPAAWAQDAHVALPALKNDSAPRVLRPAGATDMSKATLPRFAYWPGVAIPLALHVMEALAASVSPGQVRVTPWSSVTTILLSTVSPVLVTKYSHSTL